MLVFLETLKNHAEAFELSNLRKQEGDRVMRTKVDTNFVTKVTHTSSLLFIFGSVDSSQMRNSVNYRVEKKLLRKHTVA